jgi:hypothetical protein
MPEIFDPFAQRKEPAIFDPFAQRTEEKPEKKVEAKTEEKKKPTKPADEEYGVGSFAADALKKISGALVGGVGSMPEGLEQGARGTVRTALTGETPTPGFKMLDTARMVLADKLGIRSAEESLKDKEKASINAEKVLDTIPHIPGLRSLSDYAYGVQKNIEDSISDPGKARIEGATPKGNIFKGEFSFGDDPTISGYALQAAGVFGSMGPVLAVSMLTKDPTKAVTRGTVVGGGMAAGEGAQNAREKLEKLSTDELYQVSPFYKNLVDGGVAPARAKEMTVSKASETGAILQGLVGALGSNVTSKLMSGAFDHLVSKVGKGALTRFGVTGTAGGLEEGLQELGEGVAANVGVKQVLPSQELGEDSAANLALGFLGGAGPSGIKGALTPPEKQQELQKGSILDTHGGEQNVGQPISPATGAGVGVDTQPPAATTTTGAGEPDTSGVVRTNRTAERLTDREVTSTSSLEDFHRQYNDLRDELLGLINKPNPTPAERRQLDMVYRDFSEVVRSNADKIEAAGARVSSFLNPAYDGNQVIGEIATNDVVGKAKASQGNMFGSFAGANRAAQSAMALAGRDPAQALQQLEDRKQRALAEFEKNKDDPVFGMTYGSQLGMTKGEAARNPEAVAKHILDQTLANIEQAAEQLKRRARPSQGDMFGEGKQGEIPATKAAELTEDEKAKLLEGEQGEMIGDTTDPATIARMELIKKQEEIEKRRKDVAYEVTQTTPQERLQILAEREADLKRKHQAALAEHKRLADLGARPVEERFARPSGSEIDRAKAMAVSYNKELNDVRKEIEKTKKEAETYTPPVQAKVAEAAAPTTVESTQEQPKLFADEAGASIQGEATKYVTPSGEGFKLPTQAKPAPLPTAVDKDKYLSKEEQENISAAKENRLADATEEDLKAAVVIRDAALKKLRALEASLQEAAAKDAPKSQIDKIMADIEVAKQEYRVAAIEVADIYDVLESKGVKFKSKDVSQKLDEDEELETDTEHIPQTEEGGIISDFFDSIQPESNEEASVTRHGSSKGTAATTLLEYDIAEPGQKSSEGAQKMLDYLASRVGGVEKLKDLISALYNATPAQQSRMFEKLDLPDLTTIRGMDKFRDEVQQFVNDLHSSGEGVNLISRNTPSPFHGRTIPYTETITTTGIVTKTSKYESGKPRRPNQVEIETQHVIVDKKWRPALTILKQTLSSGKKNLSDRQRAAINYLSSKNRSTLGEALADLAFDLAYGVIDPKRHGANSTFFGEGGEYARDFREWVVLNLDQSTVDILNAMVAEHARNHAERVKFKEATSKFVEDDDAYSKNQTNAYEKRTGQKVKRAPKKVRIGDIKEEQEERLVNVKNLPSISIVHPVITRMLEQGKVQEALEVMVNAKGNPYYASLAQRLLDTGMTAKSRLIDVDVIESLNNDPAIKESLEQRLEVLRDIVVTMYPTAQQATIIAGLRSSKLRELHNAIQTLQHTIDSVGASEAQKQALENANNLLVEEFNWNGKYDPATDEIVLRSGGGRLTNHLFLHETLHAAASHLIDNADKLTGIQRQGYDRLVELYEYSKNTLQGEEFANEFYDLHEFVSYALTDPIFQAHLRTLGYKNWAISLWNEFTQALRKMFNAKPGRESNVMVETMLATDALLAGTMSLEGLNTAGGAKPMATGARKAAPARRSVFRRGMPNQPGTIRRLLTSSKWSRQAIKEFQSMSANARPAALGLLTLRQLDDLVDGRIPQLSNFIKVTEDFLARKNNILKESGEISKEWQKLQGKDPEMSRQIGLVMHMATMIEVDPDKATVHQRNANQQMMIEWNKLDVGAKKIYRDVRDFYDRRYSSYKQLMNRRIVQMRQMGVSEKTILEIRNEFEKGKLKGPYFPLMRFGRFWYEIGPRGDREYYMFESQAARDAHIEERIAKDPHLADTIGSSIGNDYKSQMDYHAQQSNFLKEAFNAVDNIDVTGLSPKDADEKKQALKDSFYQSFLAYQPDKSIRSRFNHRHNKAGYSEDALRSFASSSFNMAYQLARFEYSPAMFSQLEAAKLQLKDRFDPKVGYDPAVIHENDELNDYVGEVKRRLDLILNPTDIGTIPSMLSNVGFIYYLSSAASAITNVLGGVVIGFPTLVGQKVKLNPNMSYTEATARTLYETSKAAAQVMAGAIAHGAHGIDNLTGTGVAGGIASPLDRFADLTPVERAAYNKFVAEGLIDITATYDQSGLASTPTENYSGFRHRSMQVLTYLFHNAERFNREVVAMSAFRSAYEEATKSGVSPRAAFTKAVTSAKDVTNRSMFDYSSTNKPRYFQHPVARIILQFKQFPQQMTFFLAHNLVNSLKGETPEVKREARARFVGTMGMAAIMSGGTGLWGFSTVAAIVNCVFNFRPDDEDEIPFDFELAFVDWATKTFGKQVGTAIARGIPNAVTGLDIGGRVKLDDMWWRDGRKNQDEADALQSFLVDSLGPTIGIGVNAFRAVDLWNQGHGDRAIEAVSPAFIKNVLIAKRMAKEGGATNLSGDLLTQNDTPFTLLMQSAGLRSQELAERQYYNITIKGQEQAVLKERQNLLNYYALTFMSNEYVSNREAFEDMMKFNKKHGRVAIDADTIVNSLFNRYVKKATTDHGLYIDERMRSLLTQQHNYLAE